MNKSRILVVDDEPNLSELVRFFLEKTNRFEVRTENRAAQALAVTREFQPELILLDVDMPGKDGGDLAREAARDPRLRNVPILFLTGLVSHAEAGTAPLESGGMRFLAKPVEPTLLLAEVDRLAPKTIAA